MKAWMYQSLASPWYGTGAAWSELTLAAHIPAPVVIEPPLAVVPAAPPVVPLAPTTKPGVRRVVLVRESDDA